MSLLCQDKTNVILRHPHSGLVLDGSEQKVKLQHFTGNASQLWKLEDAGVGKYFIFNKGNGKVLDICEGASSGHDLITFNKHGGLNQQWFINSDGTIVSAEGDLAVDICRKKYSAGAQIIAFERHGKTNQQFQIQNQ